MTDAAPAPTQKAKKASKPKKPATHPKYIEMIAVAVGALKERGGSSRQAILKYIQANYKLGDNATAVNAHLKLALKSGVKAGTLKQAKGTGASGCFKIGEVKKAAKKAGKPKAAKQKKTKTPLRVSVLVAIALLALCVSVNGWGWGRRSEGSSRSSRRSRSSRINSLSSSRSSSISMSSRINLLSSSRSSSISRFSRRRLLSSSRSSSSSMSSFSRRIGNLRRSSQPEVKYAYHYNITLTVDPLDFNTYNGQDWDVTFDKDEMHAIFGSTELVDDLFADLDEMGDGIVTEKDFSDMAPAVISACMDTKK